MLNNNVSWIKLEIKSGLSYLEEMLNKEKMKKNKAVSGGLCQENQKTI